MVNKVRELFTVRNDEKAECTREMDYVSRAFGSLLSIVTNQESQLVFSIIIASICETVRTLMYTALYS